MTITVYSNFKKRPNSTKQPTGGTSVTATLKDKTSIETPTFLLAGSLSTYENTSYIKWGSRYYFVTDVSSVHNGVTEISAALDRLATFKTDIGSSRQYIERATNLNDTQVPDPLATTKPITYFKAVRDTVSPIPAGSLTDGYIALTVASTDVSPMGGGGTAVYFFKALQDSNDQGKTIAGVINKLFSIYSALQNVFADAYHAIVRCTYIPCVSYDTLSGSSNFEVAEMVIGNTSYNDLKPLRYKYPSANPVPFTHRYNPNILSIAQGPVTEKWTWRQPYSSWKLYLPFYGVVEFSPDDYLDVENYSDPAGEIIIDSSFDYATGDLVYIRKKKLVTNVGTKYYILDRYQTCIGIDIPLTQSSGGNVIGLMQNGIQTLSGLATQDATRALGGIIGGIASGLQTSNSIAGGFGGKGVTTASAECLKDIDESALEARRPLIAIYNSGVTFIPENYSDTLGLPYMQSNTISACGSGYVKTSNASVSIAGTQADKDAVNSMMDAGFYYE